MLARPPAHWILDLDVHGAIYRYASNPLTVTTRSGQTWRYEEGLPELELPLVAEGTIGRSISLTIADETDWPLLVSRNQSPDRAPCVLRWIREGQDLEDARVILRGIALVSRIGLPGEGIDLRLTREPSATPRTIPPPSAIVSEDTWPVTQTFTPESTSGLAYPIIIGEPGNDVVSGVLSFPKPVVPALLAEFTGGGLPATWRWILGLGRLELGSNVRLYNATTGTVGSTGAAPYYTTDLAGRTITVVAVGVSGVANAVTDAYYVGFASADGWGGGIQSPYSTGPLRGAGEVIRWAMAQAGRKVDHARIASYASELNGYKVDTWINASIDPLDWLEAAVLSWLPVIMVEGGDGLYVRPLRWDATTEDAVAHLEEGRGVERVGSMVQLDDAPVNEVTVQYRKAREGGYLRQVTLTAQAGRLSGDASGVADDARIYASALAARSQQYYGQVYQRTITLDHTWHTPTAIQVAEDALRRQALPRRVVTYEGGTELDVLEPGDVVLVTDGDLYLTEQPALVGEITLTPEAATVTVVLLSRM